MKTFAWNTYNQEGSGEKRYDEVLQGSRCESHVARDVLITCENAHFPTRSVSYSFLTLLLINVDPFGCACTSWIVSVHMF